MAALLVFLFFFPPIYISLHFIVFVRRGQAAISGLAGGEQSSVRYRDVALVEER